jgi:hypothetical protein
MMLVRPVPGRPLPPGHGQTGNHVCGSVGKAFHPSIDSFIHVPRLQNINIIYFSFNLDLHRARDFPDKY